MEDQAVISSILSMYIDVTHLDQVFYKFKLALFDRLENWRLSLIVDKLRIARLLYQKFENL